MPRKSSVSSLNPPLASPRDAGLPSPRTRTGFDGVLGGSDSWMARRRTSDATRPSGIALSRSTDTATAEGKKDPEIKEEQEEEGQRVGLGIGASVGHASNGQPSATNGHLANTASGRSGPSTVEGLDQSFDKMSLGAVPGANLPGPNGAVTHAYPLGSHVIAPQPPPPTTAELSAVEWSYVDPAGNIQGMALFLF
jgi:PERQ amino acid-rich with GYF domain-containing protein